MSFVTVAQVVQLDQAKPLAVDVDDELTVALVLHGTEVYAIEDQCSHGKVELSEGDVDQTSCSIECYLHGSTFDLRTGAALNLPATQPVRVFAVRIEGDDVLVDPDNPLTFTENT